MKKIMNYLIAAYLTMIPNILYSKEIKSSLKSLELSARTDVALPLAGIGLIIAGIYFVVGNQSASQKLANVIIGVFVILASTSIISFFTRAVS